jgi:DHA2 family multidrug resistance protein
MQPAATVAALCWCGVPLRRGSTKASVKTISEAALPAASAGPKPAPKPVYRAQADVTEFGLRRVLIVAGVMLAALMQTLDSTITNVALPTIQGNLGASQDEGTWVITAYVIAAIVIIPLTPWLQNRFGRRNYFLVSIVGFTLASIVCGTSESLTTLILARAVQGAFGGGLLATGQSIMRDTFPPSQLAASQGIFALGAIMGPALGPPLGGYLVDNFSWNWCFEINILPGIISAVVLFLLLRDPSKADNRTPIDGMGLALLAIGLSSLQYVVTEGEQYDWFEDPIILSISVVCAVALAAFVWWELTQTENPVVDLRILRNRSVWAGSVLAFSLGISVFGSSYVLPQYTQGSLGYTPTLSGLLFILRALPIALCTPIAVRLSGKVDSRYLLGSGFVCASLGSYLQGRITSPSVSFWDFFVPLALTGVGSALLWVPLSVAILGATTPREGPKAAAFTNLSVQLGGSISVAVLAVILHGRESFHSAIIGSGLTTANPVVQQFLTDHPIQQLAQLAYAQSTIIAFGDVNYAIALLSLLCIPLIFLMRRRKNAGPVGHIEIEMG